MDGKAMIVGMSRRICIDLYNEIVALRPDWHNPDDDKGVLKVVMTGSASGPVDWQQHLRNKPRREELAKRFKDAKDPFAVVIVRDMWLTGFDAPCLHKMDADKPMRGQGLMQAIARVNRVFKDKPGGLVVDYPGLAHELKQALATYTESCGKGQTAIDQAEAVALMREKFEICEAFFHGFDRASWTTGPATRKLTLLPAAQDHVLKQDGGKSQFVKGVEDLSKAFALAVPADEALAQELVKAVRTNLSIDWAVRENVRANLRVIIKRTLRKYGYPPDKQEKATQTVLEQLEVLSRAWTAGGELVSEQPGARP